MVLPALFAAGVPAALSGSLMAAGHGLSKSAFNGSLFGTTGTQSRNGTTSRRFDASQLGLFNKQLGVADQASAKYANFLRGLSGQRTGALRADLDRQLDAVQGYRQQEIADTNRRYDSRQGNVGQSLANRGLYNSSVAPGMNALVERERNSALGQARSRQQQYMGGIMGQRAQLLDNANVNSLNQLAQLGGQDYQLRTLLPQNIARSTVGTTTNQTTNKTGGLFSSLFG
ncbi:hypothetical protein LF1_41590 [Rubripirellula obstinata]|uniref:Uncharacterized protein n=1 Tax=Rubripirellula obstinata TaxID=406547 RepID=A0A5B1CKL9_9BACT|nr:hypothetical protein [Rubripirellula obstinata]KAA1261608.1 hypothetical protein LF1_41590 [Rubripirellula obstinata]